MLSASCRRISCRIYSYCACRAPSPFCSSLFSSLCRTWRTRECLTAHQTRTCNRIMTACFCPLHTSSRSIYATVTCVCSRHVLSRVGDNESQIIEIELDHKTHFSLQPYETSVVLRDVSVCPVSSLKCCPALLMLRNQLKSVDPAAAANIAAARKFKVCPWMTSLSLRVL